MMQHGEPTQISDILIVADKPENLTVLMDILITGGYRVRPAINSKIALQAVQTEHPDLVLLDIMLPEINGYELCRQLKSDPRTEDIPVLFVSSLNGSTDKVKGFEVGGVDYITRPFQHTEVLTRVKHHLAIRNIQKELQEKNRQLSMEIRERKQAEKALSQANNILKRMASLDGVTLIANRDHFNRVIIAEWKRMAREEKPLALIICDIACFEKYNESTRHFKGDDCLKQVAQCISNTINRPADIVARYGEYKFAVLLPHTDRRGAYKLAEKILTAVRDLMIPTIEVDIALRITMSIGISCRIPAYEASPEILIDDAETALCKAKESERYKIIIL